MTAPKTPKFPALPGNASRVEELDYFISLRQAINGNTYLATLLSQELFAWFADVIKDDFSPDIYTDYKGEQANSNTLAADLRGRMAEIERLKSDIAAEKSRTAHVQNELDHARENLLDLATQQNSERIEARENREKYDDDISHLEALNTQMEGEIIRLKAQLWDLSQK